MRRLLTLFATIGVTAPALAQGMVDFNNNRSFTTTADRLVRDWSSGIPLVGTDYVAQLYYGTHGTEPSRLIPVASSPARFRAETTRMPGCWSGGTRTLQGMLTGQTATLQVRVWNGSLYPTYEDAVGSFNSGVSALFNYTVPSAGTVPAAFFMDAFSGVWLNCDCCLNRPDCPVWPPSALTWVVFDSAVLLWGPGDPRILDSAGQLLVGPEFAAQLYCGRTPSELRPAADARAPFHLPSWSFERGTWSGGRKRLDGFSPGETVWMQVRVWNAALFPAGYEAALEAGAWHWASCPFTYTIPTHDPPPTESSFYISNFRGNACTNCCTPGWFNYWRTSNSLVLDWESVRVTQKTDLADPAWVAVTNQVFSLTSGPRFFKVEGNFLLLADP